MKRLFSSSLLLVAGLALLGCVPAGNDGPAPTDLYLIDIWAERGLVWEELDLLADPGKKTVRIMGQLLSVAVRSAE